MLEEWLIRISEPVIVIIDLMALFIVVCGTLIAFVSALRALGDSLLHPAERGQRGYIKGHERRVLWMEYGRWLVAALTFQLGADIIESAIAPSWQAIAQLGAVALIRTFLNYFLERDMGEVREREDAAGHPLRAHPETPSTPG